MTLCRYIPSICPLRQPQIAVDVAEQGGGRAKAVPVRDGGPLARLPVLARNAECAVALLAERGSALPVRGFQRGRVHLELPLVPGVTGSHALDGELLELRQRRAGHHVNVPWLKVGSGRRPRRRGKHALKHLSRDALVGESAYRPSARYRLIDVHNRLSYVSSLMSCVGPVAGGTSHALLGAYPTGRLKPGAPALISRLDRTVTGQPVPVMTQHLGRTGGPVAEVPLLMNPLGAEIVWVRPWPPPRESSPRTGSRTGWRCRRVQGCAPRVRCPSTVRRDRRRPRGYRRGRSARS